jgi:probable blue pigment (indigoidine) exporter
MNPVLYGMLIILATSLMGSSFAVGKMGLVFISPLLLTGIRFTIAGLIMAIVVKNKNLPASKQDWAKLAMVGFFQTTGVMGCIFLSLRTISAGESSILTFVNPLLVVVLGTWFLGIRYRYSQWIGVIVGFAWTWCSGILVDCDHLGEKMGLPI